MAVAHMFSYVVLKMCLYIFFNLIKFNYFAYWN